MFFYLERKPSTLKVVLTVEIKLKKLLLKEKVNFSYLARSRRSFIKFRSINELCLHNYKLSCPFSNMSEMISRSSTNLFWASSHIEYNVSRSFCIERNRWRDFWEEGRSPPTTA